jgi:hypothetical protein
MEIKPEDRKALDGLKSEIDNPATSSEWRAECREDYAGIAEGYFDLFTTDEERAYYDKWLAERPPDDPSRP